MAQELKFHGVEIAGPAKTLQQTGARGRYRSNVKRDMIRKVGQVAARLHMYM